MTYAKTHHKIHLSHCLTPNNKPTPFLLLNLMMNEIVYQPQDRPACPKAPPVSSATGPPAISCARHIYLGFANAPAISIPQKLTHDQYTGPVIEIEEYCNGVVHPVTKETITHYRNLIKDPLLRDLWLKAMNKELCPLTQGCTSITKGTTTIFFFRKLTLATSQGIEQSPMPAL
jgi:hypothetical protein